jgi:hypothetical protein
MRATRHGRCRGRPGRLRYLEGSERRRQATEAEACSRPRFAQELMQSGSLCHAAIMPGGVSNEINGLQGLKTRGRKGQLLPLIHKPESVRRI